MKPMENLSVSAETKSLEKQSFRCGFRSLKGGVRLVLLACVCATAAAGQAMVAYGHAVAGAAAANVSMLKPKIAPLEKSSSLVLPAVKPGPTAEEANRQALETTAGKRSAKLMLRSVPSSAKVRVDGKAVGRTPLLLIIAPGVHAVELSGGVRSDYGRQRVDLLPSETREVILTLAPRYPAQLRMSWPAH